MNDLLNFVRTSGLIGRKESFLFTVAEMHRRWPNQAISIVETGTTRKKTNEVVAADGGSTILWGAYASKVNGKVWTCDISPQNIEECKRWTGQYSNWVTYVVQDSVEFLSSFTDKIDLLYLDSYDTSDFDRAIIEAACVHQLKEINAANDKLKEDSLILLDDVRPNLRGGKSEFTIPFLLDKGWKIISHQAEQVLFSK